MTNRNRPGSLRCLPLEDRVTPALTGIVIDDLTVVRGVPEDNLIIKALSDDEVSISDGESLVVNLPVSGDLFIQTFRRSGIEGEGKILVDLDDNTLPGNLLLDLGRGDGLDNTLAIDNLVEISNGTIAGDLTILRGDGGELVDLGGFLAPGKALTVLGDVNAVGRERGFPEGDSLTVNDKSAVLGDFNATLMDTVSIGVGGPELIGGDVNVTNPTGTALFLEIAAEVGGDVNVTGSFGIQDSIDIGQDQAAVIRGDVRVNALTSFVGEDVEISALIEGDVHITTGAGPDLIIIEGTIDGDLGIDAGEGDNLFDFADVALVDADVSIRAGSGDNDLSLFSSKVFGDLSIHLGDGDNVVNFGAGGFVGGSFRYGAGNGVNEITNEEFDFSDVWIDVGNGTNENLLTLTAVNVNGDLTIRAGNGGNNVVLDNAEVADELTFDVGNGDDTLDITSDSFFDLDVTLAAGDDLIDFNDSEASVSGLIDGGVGDDTLAGDDSVTFVPPFTVRDIEN